VPAEQGSTPANANRKVAPSTACAVAWTFPDPAAFARFGR
jgi:hypothetical protein